MATRSRAGTRPPHGQLTDRVQQVGPEHFGIVSIDCAKARSKYMLADFYGRVLIPPTFLPHTRGNLQAALQRIDQAMGDHDLRDLAVAIERTGEYLPSARWRCTLGTPFYQPAISPARRPGQQDG
jgi:hypothetical protein